MVVAISIFLFGAHDAGQFTTVDVGRTERGTPTTNFGEIEKFTIIVG